MTAVVCALPTLNVISRTWSIGVQLGAAMV